jgi:hypothetical protein
MISLKLVVLCLRVDLVKNKVGVADAEVATARPRHTIVGVEHRLVEVDGEFGAGRRRRCPC